MTPEDLEKLKTEGWRKKAAEMSDYDISVSSDWEHQQNIYSSMRLLEELKRYHGDRYAGI